MTGNVEVGKYLVCKHSFNCYKELTTGNFAGTLDPLEFFEVLNNAHALIISNRANPLAAIFKLKELISKYSGEGQLYIYAQLEYKIALDLNELRFNNNAQIEICLNLITDELNAALGKNESSEEDEGEEEITFNWKETKKHVDSLPDAISKMVYLIDIKTLYHQEVTTNGKESTGFYEKCNLELERIKQQEELKKMQVSYGGNLLLSSTKGVRIDFIRVINAMYEMRFFQDTNGQIPSKETVMKSIGGALGVNLTKYDVDLSQAFINGTAESNVAIFQQMSKITTKEVTKRLNK